MRVAKNNVISNYLEYLILIFPISLTLGPTFIEIFSGLLIIFFFIKVDKGFYQKNKFYINFFLIFYSYLVVRSLFFSNEFEKIRSILFYFRFLFFCCAVIYCLNKINFTKKFNIKYIFFIFLLLILDSILQYYYGRNILNIPLYNTFRASSFFGKELILGSFLFRMLPFILIICILFKLDLKKNILKLSIFFSLYFFAVLISGERTSFFLLFLTILLLIILVKNFRKILLCGLIFFLFINLIFSFSNKNPYDRMLKQTFSQMISQKVDSKVDLELDSKLKENLGNLELNNKINSFSNNYVFSREHQGHYIIALRMFLDNPIFGQGPRSFRYLCSEDRFIKSDGICTTHPHNTYLQLLAETGLIGFLFIFVLFLFTLKELVRKFLKNFKHQNRDNNYVQIKYISLIAIFVSLFPLAPSGNFFNNWLSFVYYYPIAFYIYSINKSKN
jgi:O-antigen ligase